MDSSMKTETSYQQFDSDASSSECGLRLKALRSEMKKTGIDAFILARSDPYLGEWIAPCDERLAWLTGFTGSAGCCIVFSDSAVLLVDGRYRLQARHQTDNSLVNTLASAEYGVDKPILQNLRSGGTVGFDSRLSSRNLVKNLCKHFEKRQIKLLAVENLVDRIWLDQPNRPAGPVRDYPEYFAGESRNSKLSRIGKAIEAQGSDLAVITLSDSIAWLLNIRGSDVARAPLPHCFLILRANGWADLFVDKAKLCAQLVKTLEDCMTIRPESDFQSELSGCTGVVQADPRNVSEWVFEQLRRSSATVKERQDPCILPKATKNSGEIECAREAHLRDSVAVAEFLAWLSMHSDGAGLSEIDIVRRLEAFRLETGVLEDISFDTIAGSGPNGATVHYRVTTQSDRKIRTGDLLLIDSGAQYPDGTTDVTRTISVGHPEDQLARYFTCVLKALIALSQARWPSNATGRDLDCIARYPLWMAGMDYDHGTGHGVGHNLCVHEGPASLSKNYMKPLLPGMIMSIEPGMYKDGEFGIRIENLAVVEEDSGECTAGPMLRFSTLTHVPIDRRLICAAELSAQERNWLNSYHSAIVTKIAKRCSSDAEHWLKQACAPI